MKHDGEDVDGETHMSDHDCVGLSTLRPAARYHERCRHHDAIVDVTSISRPESFSVLST